MGILGKDPTEGMSPRAYDDYMSQIKANNADRASDKRTHAITYRLDKQIELLTKILERLEMVYIIPLVSEDQEQTPAYRITTAGDTKDNKEEVHKARIKLIQELQHPLEYRIEERARLDTFGWMTAQELMEQGQPVKHLSIPGRKFYRYMGTIICEQDDGVKHKMSDVAAKAVLQALLPQGWRIA